MMRQRSGTIVCLSSGAREGTPWTAYYQGGAAYSAAKVGVHGFIRDVALELAEHGIRSNCVSPGFTHTDMTEKAVGPELMGYLNGQFARVPMKRLVRTDEVANAILFLASDDASAITGIDLRVDCGLTSNWFILETLPEH